MHSSIVRHSPSIVPPSPCGPRGGGERGCAAGILTFGAVTPGSAFGAEIAYTFGIGANYLRYPKPPDTFIDVLASDDLVEGAPRAVDDRRVPVLLPRYEG